MFPTLLYELLPYFYLAVGAVGFALFESNLILFASVLLMLAGFIILWMRIDFRRNAVMKSETNISIDKRSNQDRRQNHFAIFPLVDTLGQLVEENRRIGERRQVL